METTFMMIKPDGVQRSLIGEVIKRVENKGLKLRGLKFLNIDKSLAEKLYDIHASTPFFSELVGFVTSSPVVVMVVSGPEAVKVVRNLLGATQAANALPGTIRGDFGITTGKNIVHASDATDRAKYEFGLFFRHDELVDYDKIIEPWL